MFIFYFKLLEQLGIFPKIKRFAGTSAGAMTAALLAVGYNSNEIEESLSQDLSRIFLGMITLSDYVINYLIYLIHFFKSIRLTLIMHIIVVLNALKLDIDYGRCKDKKKNDERLF